MERRICIVLMLLVPMAVGCVSQPSGEDPRKPQFVRELEGEGITYRNTSRVIVRDTESGYGGSAHVIAREPFIVQGIWDSIFASRPYDKYCFCGWRKIEFYTKNAPDKPVATILVNETGTTRLEGKEPEEGFRCPGLAELVSRLLDHKYRKPTEKPTARATPAVASDTEE